MRMCGSTFFYSILVYTVWSASAAPPVLNSIPTPVVALSEHESTEQVLVEGIACKDPDGDPTRVFTQYVIPSHPCGKCFPIWPCGKGKYCLMFEPSLGRLYYDSVSSYLVQVTCTDDVDSDVSTGTIEIRLTSNSPPTFTNPANGGESIEVKSTSGRRAGDVIYDVDADDADKDAVFYTMTTEPFTDLFDIGYGDGKIRATQDLRLLCEDTVTFYVHAADSYNSPVGPAVVRAVFKKRNERPLIMNTETVVEVPENTAASLKIQVDDPDGDDVIYKLRAKPEQGLEYYAIDHKGTITSRKTLDYEYADLRSVRLFVDVTDGFCDAETYSVTMLITDVNEPPDIGPDPIERTVYEGLISLDPNWNLHDPDSSENHEWRIVSGGSGHFTIDTKTGVIHSNGELDIDPDEWHKFVLKVEVKDREGVKDSATLRITVLDRNDHVPMFHKHLYKVNASPCTKVGAHIGNVNAKDEDSQFQGNNMLMYSGVGQNITVLGTGDVVLTSHCTLGERETIQAFVTDQGIFPGPLSGVPTTVAFTCSNCPEPVTTDASTDVTDIVVDSTMASGVRTNDDFLTSNLGWIVPAIFLSMLLFCTAYVICRRCCHACARWRARRALLKKYPKVKKSQTKPVTTTTPKEERPVELKARPKPPLPPSPPPTDTEPFFFGFWKETFLDRDQRRMPKRDSIPASVEQDQRMEEMDRKEEEREKEKRRLARLRLEEDYKRQLEKYHRELCAVNDPSRPTSSSSKKTRCSIS